MARPKFNWDAYAARAKFDEVRDLCASHGRLPTMYNPDRTLVYLSSQDLAVAVDDLEELQTLLAEVKRSFFDTLGYQNHSYKKLYELETDYDLLSNLLSNLDSPPDHYGTRLPNQIQDK
ncbi:hypothetical protein IFR08_11375 [Pseudomonas fluorescens]|uniref:hypothetical protein n=1 Tax=Pseudomonas fluorescens TaxID=294 RepID=UPI00177ADE8B|nr:hypothetical protein [Pseudomonas fluorescens]MBD8098781.1 hypothetical protein [Pseudomonas fluorescens]MBD8774365.1 hypothetical protein [Pseudomonas fluorescens]MBD8780182.1 hypothetical protein [Pseudomonas fluorescens]MBD8797189.1 hypothetical protein [Pseudomonas fluorescens]